MAVVDSGVSAPSPMAPLTVADRLAFGVGGPVTFGQGTNLAGLVAGGAREDGEATGVAPAASIVDLRVYAAPLDSGALDVPTENVTAAVRWLVEHAEADGIGVVVVGFDVEGDAALARAVRDLARRDVVIVAATGDRPIDGQPGFEEYGGAPAPGEDVSGQVLPAGYDGVLGVTSTAGGVASADASTSVLLSRDIDVAVPTYGAVALAPNGATCAIDPIGSAPAAGSRRRRGAAPLGASDDNACQIVSPLTASASGSWPRRDGDRLGVSSGRGARAALCHDAGRSTHGARSRRSRSGPPAPSPSPTRSRVARRRRSSASVGVACRRRAVGAPIWCAGAPPGEPVERCGVAEDRGFEPLRAVNPTRSDRR